MAVQKVEGQGVGGEVRFGAIYVAGDDTHCHCFEARRHALEVCPPPTLESKSHSNPLRSKEDSKQISGLVEEINVLKTLIIENYNNVSELQRAEQKSEAEARRHPSRHISISPAAEHPDTHQEPSAGDRIEIHSDETHLESPVSSHSESDHDYSEPNTMPGNARRVSSQAQGGRQKSDPEKDDGKAADKDSRSAVQPVSAYRGTAGPDTQPVSSLLLQMIPYRPRAPKTNRRR